MRHTHSKEHLLLAIVGCLALVACAAFPAWAGADVTIRRLDSGVEQVPAVSATALGAADDDVVVVGVSDKRRMDEVRARIKAMGGTVRKRYRWGGYLVEMPATADKATFTASAKSIPGVEYVTEQAYLYAVESVPSSPAMPTAPRATFTPTIGEGWLTAAYTPNDPHLPMQWGVYRIGCPAAWDVAMGGPIIAIVDSGVDYTHPDLAGGVILGWDFVDNDADPMDQHYHGTGMAGMAGATTNNGIGGAGVAPESYLLAVRVLNHLGTGSVADVAEGIVYAADAGADVINLSLSGRGPTGMEPVINAVAYARSKGCLVIAASGNVNVSAGITDSMTMYPAACDGVVGVGATTSSTPDAVWTGTVHGTRADGSPVVTVGAPGVDIYGPYPGSMAAFYTGTSASTALVSGAAAVVWSEYPDATADDVASLLASSALDVLAPGQDVESGWGRIQLDQAVTYAAPDAFEPPAPSSLVATWTPPGARVDLTWADNSASEAGFVVERARNSTDPVAFSHIATTAPNATSYADTTGLDWTSTWYYRVRAFNAAGVSAWVGPVGVRLPDTTPPVSTLLVNGLPPAGRWFNASHAVSVTATDTQSGVAGIRVDHGSGVETYTVTFTMPEGSSPVTYWAVDAVGNVEASRIETVNVDLTGPTVSSDATTTPYRGEAVINISAADSLSGVAEIAYRVGGGADVGGSQVTLGPGTHALQYRARDAVGNWGDYSATTTISVTSDLTVYRFYRPSTGTHFYTASTTERDRVRDTLSSVYQYEGPSYVAFADDVGGAVPVYRFYRRSTGTHFYTASPTERDLVLTQLGGVYVLEGIAYYVRPTSGPDTRTVHRFFNRRAGVHFYTASEEERAAVQANLGHIFTYEGPAFYVSR